MLRKTKLKNLKQLKKLKRIKRIRNNFLVLFLILLGLLLAVHSLFTHTQIYYRYYISKTESQKLEYTLDKIPLKLSIPAQRINVEIEQGGIKNGEWILSDINALYLPTSGKLGEGYNTIIYAHNSENLFANLNNVLIGETVVVTDQLGKVYEYEVISSEVVRPQDLDKLYSKEKNILTVFTCNGWGDRERLVVRARLVR